jgi:hypothetical protein
MYGYIPASKTVKAASLDDLKDTISDSDISETLVTHTIMVDFGTADLTAGQRIRIDFSAVGASFAIPAASGASTTCPTNTTASATAATFESTFIQECVVDAGQTLSSTTDHTITIGSTTNPNAESPTGYTVTVSTRDTDGTEIESSQAKFYIIDDVQVTASVDASLSFDVALVNGSDGATVFDNVTCDATTTATEIPFGTLPTTGTTTACQQLTVSTNADTGFAVTIVADDELTSAAGANINSFNNSPDGTGSTTPEAWASPTAILDQDHTYGHMGITSSDDDVTPKDNLFIGLNGTDPSPTLMSHNGPVNGATTPSQGQAYIGYTIEISNMQEAGDYTANVSYICTPTY